MSMHDLLETIRTFEGVLEVAPSAGGPYPEISWGDHYFYYAPDGVIPHRVQPYATVVTKDYPDDTASQLQGPDRWRVNIHIGRDRARRLLGDGDDWDFAATDTLLPHPLYGRQGWIAVVTPGKQTTAAVVELLDAAHREAKRRWERR